MASVIPVNEAPFSLAEIIRATGARVPPAVGVTSEPGDGALVRGVTTDSRGDVSGKLFVPLVGERFDGHDFVRGAIERGAGAVLVERDVDVPPSITLLRVDSTLTALGDLARYHRRRWAGRVIAVAGSAGKTTTRSAIAALLRAVHADSTHAVSGNLNNRVGVPMVLFALSAQHQVSVVELGTNQRGEVAELARIAEPEFGVLTLVDWEHSEGLGSIDDIEQEEGDSLAALPPHGVAFVNADDPRALRQAERSRARLVRFGTSDLASTDAATTAAARSSATDYCVVDRTWVGSARSRVRVRRADASTLELEVPLVGVPGALALAAAVAVTETVVGRSLNPQSAQRALDAAEARSELGESGRLRPIELADGSLVLDDTYNSNPASVERAIETARELARDRTARLVLVLGEMRELGRWSEQAHRDVGRELDQADAALVVGVCGDARWFCAPDGAGVPDRVFAPDARAALDVLLSRTAPADVILVKASRGVGAESIVHGLISTKGRAA